MKMGTGLFISLLLLFVVVFSVWGGRWYFDFLLGLATVTLNFFSLLILCGVCGFFFFFILPVVVDESVKPSLCC